MAAKTLTLVAALASNRAIGRLGEMPWQLPAELEHFKRTTMGKTIVMGRVTWQAIGRSLPGRQNIVVTRSREIDAPGCTVAHSLDEAIELAESHEVMIIGGAELYRQALPRAGRMVLTYVDCAPEADTWFPEFEPAEWRIKSRRKVPAGASNRYAFEVVDMTRIEPPPLSGPQP